MFFFFHFNSNFRMTRRAPVWPQLAHTMRILFSGATFAIALRLAYSVYVVINPVTVRPNANDEPTQWKAKSATKEALQTAKLEQYSGHLESTNTSATFDSDSTFTVGSFENVGCEPGNTSDQCHLPDQTSTETALTHLEGQSPATAEPDANATAATQILLSTDTGHSVIPEPDTDIRTENSTFSQPNTTYDIDVLCNFLADAYAQTTNVHGCKTVYIERTTIDPMEKAMKTIKRLTISSRDIEKSRKRTKVRPLKGNITSNAGFALVNRKYGSRLYFWFVQSQRDPENAPLIVWLQGQPGLSSLIGLFEEHGPYRVVQDEGGVDFELRESAWTNEFNVLYLDHCIGCGYSIAVRKEAYEPSFEMVGKNVNEALVQFFGIFPEFLSNDLYLAGEYGCAKYIPVIAHAIHARNAIDEPKMNLQGVLIGGPYVDSISMATYR